MQYILNVDDYKPSRYARTKILQQAGFEVIEASTGQDALTLVSKKNPMIVLLDVNLPDVSGFEICRKIKTDPKTRATPVLHISASSVQPSHQVHGFEAGADAYLVEPVDPGLLIATINAFLRARQAEEALRRTNEHLEWFVFRVAHDLNEPLRTITAHAQLLEKQLARRIEEEEASELGFVVNAALRMRTFIDNLLRYSQVTHLKGQPATLDCTVCLGNALRTLDAAIVASGAKITHDQLPIVQADPALEFVFQNLISNAIKYARSNVPPEVDISARREKNSWLFSVADNGIGIDVTQQSEIFKIFHRLHGGDIPGNGIGLALAEKIIQAQGGSIWVESTPGVGSRFYFTIPRDTSQDAIFTVA